MSRSAEKVSDLERAAYRIVTHCVTYSLIYTACRSNKENEE